MIESSRLAQFFKDNPRKGQEVLPELIKKLTIASANFGVTSLRFPSGDSIWVSSFDGYVTDISVGDDFLPVGNSIWEFGTNKEYKTKITKDYKKRTEEAVFFEKADYTFIICTPFVFDGNILDFENQMQNDKIWKNVKIYDAVKLADWLNKHIEVILWLFGKFNNVVTDHRISTAEDCLNSYYSITKPQLSSDIIICSQNNNEGNQIEDFKNNLKSQEHGAFVLFSPISIEHGTLFSLSVISNEQPLFEKSIVVENQESLTFIENNFSNKVVIINFYWNGTGLRLNKNRYIYTVTDEGKYPQQKLNNIRFEDFKTNLEKMGFDSREAYKITEKTNRNISCLKRMLAIDPLLRIPTWANDTQRNAIIPLALVSEIDRRFEGDIAIVNQLYNGTNYINVLESQLLIDESPIFHLDNIYKINYKEEVFFVLNIENEDSYIKKLENILKEIMNDTDPIYLQDVKDWDFRRKNHKYSSSLINGIVETFIILVMKKPSCQAHYDSFIGKILENSLNNFTVLNSVLDYLPLMAELSPKAILKFINETAQEENENFKKTFEIEFGNSLFHEKSKFYDYKFAIDKCLYNKETAVDALRLIFNLYNSNLKFPKNFKISDYVSESFCPFTSVIIPVKPYDKLRLLKSMINNNNKGKSLYVVESFIYGKVSQFLTGTPLFKYRENPEKVEIDVKEMLDISHEAILYLLDNKDNRITLYEDLLKDLHFLEDKTIKVMFDKIARDINTKDDVFKSTINYAILEKIFNIQKFVVNSQNDSWKYQSLYLNQLTELYKLSIPIDLYYKYRYLIVNPSYEIPYLNPRSWNSFERTPEYFDKEREERWEIYKKAFDELFASNIDNLSIRIIADMKDDTEIGRFLSQKSENGLDDIKKLIVTNKLNALSGYINFLNIEKLISYFYELEEQEKDTVINCLGLNEEAYSIVKNTEYEEKYWKKFDFFSNQKDSEFEKLAVEHLKKLNPLALVSHYAYSDKNISYEEKILLLESLAINIETIKNTNQHNLYSVGILVKQLDNEYYEERLISCELALLPYLISSSIDDYPKGIKRFFLENPLYLYRFLKACSVSNIGERTIGAKILSDCTISIGGHTLVSIELIRKDLKETYNYNINPNNPTKKESRLETWFDILLNELNKEKDDKVSYMIESLLILVLSLSFSYDIDNNHDYLIAMLLERLGANKSLKDKKEISNKFHRSKFNSFGVRSVGDGSDEKRIADNFLSLSEKFKIEYPIISGALKALSDSFDSMSEEDKKRKIFGDF